MTTKRSLSHRIGAVFISLQLILSTGAPLFAQRRRGEPQANPEFQQELAAPAAGSSKPRRTTRPSSSRRRRSTKGVQIGAISTTRPSPTAAVSPLESRVTVRVKGAPLATFLDTIAAQSKVNFIISEGLEQKKITAFLQNVTVREALQILLEIKGLTYQQIGKSDTFVISKRSKTVERRITRIYTLNYIPLIKLVSIAGNSSLSTTVTEGGSDDSDSSSSGEGDGGTSGIPFVDVLQTVLTPTGKVSVDPRSNSVIVTDIPEVFPAVEQLIAELDRKAPQVMIEAQIVEIDSDRARELGFEWGGASGQLVSFSGGARETTFPLDLPTDLSRLRFFDPFVGSIGGEETTAGGQVAAGIFDLTQLKVVLRALVSRSEARFLGKPKIITLNNQSAIIEVTRNAGIALKQQTASAGGSTGETNVTVERVNTGLTLSVTPQINEDGYITMLVRPSFVDVIPSAINSTANPVFDPISRSAQTLVRVKNGQTLVLGGLLQSTETKSVRKVPFLGYIPLLGWLFTSTSTKRKNSDLVIFITPTIVSD